MFSEAKHEDKLLLLEIGEMIGELTKRIEHPNVLPLIERFGEDYLALEEKIKTFNYKNQKI
jgi:hypothetical protein